MCVVNVIIGFLAFLGKNVHQNYRLGRSFMFLLCVGVGVWGV